ncbi:aminopeptidase N [Zymomonas mobilis subsp. mobilis ZM4 = ATCC 31821]|uniref:Aminopeptidase n=2 Tax=Zymomonas mobilis subsp. mobilis TaxID=120045 RepID=Q5NLL0_ZYMMO|nr:M1 family metallopeptidase [Zymomonas mobilis]AAV90400.2 Peptidase M1 membrane alanine aminopeptidase [Zymomonas mobilis subsp. mobilis ZM4 = ATCC 31821]ACV75989.1 Peptidase M1 membrane alanine aminopeptidase [Zymomonas mobilis subsp. mobilis NCIMB 11163]AEH63191.1 Peptidase M1 membrane alanine aminopeptidase [Zymomonas mobilis subsp. mobilis ATCC 10988]AVZ26587.1 aminopeptidase N [Zymomonas mobilis subsp. mobilis]AVZ28473.1 aminopeptidase N [Zymomonas mobilis subsp. mobilis]
MFKKSRLKSFLRHAPVLLLPAMATAAFANPDGRLPEDIKPLHYDISVQPNAKDLIFSGREKITINVQAPEHVIAMNAADLVIDDITLDGKKVEWKLDAPAQQLLINTSDNGTIQVGQHELTINYRGRINQSSAGLFAVDYQDNDGPQRMLVTQFEPADARYFAPMWDQPDDKATFTMAVTAPADELAFSNMPVVATEKNGSDLVTTRFAETPKMSSYLLFLGVGKLDRKAVKVGDTEIGIITRRGATDQGDYALNAASQILTYYNNYFGTPYPLPKMDMIAVPSSSQFFSAMENWGAIMYFDRAVLFDPKRSPESAHQTIFNVVAHEMAHQWFGDLVTMQWWDDLWLNEGFASWMASKVTGDLNPGWNVPAQTVAYARQAAFSMDAKSTTHPIIQHVGTVDEIDQAFDTITYSKGQAVIRMIEAAIGPDQFRDGLRQYMAANKYNNTTTDDLWKALSQASGKDVKSFADSFTLQGGVPLIRASEPITAGGITRINLAQDRFALDPASHTSRSWIVPVAIGAAGQQKAATTVTVSGPTYQTVQAPVDSLPIINPGQFGYYRTLYAPQHFKDLSDKLPSLPLSDQVGFISDSMALASGGYESFDQHLALLGQISPDSDPLLLNVVSDQIASFDGRLDHSPVQAAFRQKAIARLKPQLTRIGWASSVSDSTATSDLRESLIPLLGKMGDKETIDTAQRYLNNGLDSIPASIREAVLQVVGYNADNEMWEKLRDMAKKEKDPSGQRQLYHALAATNNKELARKTLELALTDEANAPTRAALISIVARNHPDLAFNWAVDHREKVNAFIEETARARFIANLALTGDNMTLAGQVKTYAQKYLPQRSRQSAQRVINQITYNSVQRHLVEPALKRWSNQ